MYICVAFCCLAVISCTSVEAKNQQIMHFCYRKAKKSCFALKTLIYNIFIANVAKKQHTHFIEDKILRKFADEDKPQVVQA